MSKEIEQNLNEVRKACANVSEYHPDEIMEFLEGMNEAFEVLEKIEVRKRETEYSESIYDRDDHPSPQDVYGPVELGMK